MEVSCVNCLNMVVVVTLWNTWVKSKLLMFLHGLTKWIELLSKLMRAIWMVMWEETLTNKCVWP